MNGSTVRRAVIPGLVAAVVMTAAAPRATLASGPAATTTYARADIGAAQRVYGHAARTSPASHATFSRGARATRLHRAASPTVPRAIGAGQASSGLISSFNGVSSRDSEVTNFGLEFEPPDQGLCVGNGFVLEPVNSAYRVYRTDGRTVVGPFNVNDIFNVGAEEFTSDPRCYYDPATNAWFAVILFLNSSGTASSVDIAVNTSGDPSGLWAEYSINTTHRGGNGCPCFGDQPTLGIDSHNLYITTNEFSILGPQFNGAQVYAVAKSDLVSGSSTAHVAHFGNLRIGGSVAASVQPALTTGAAPAEYFLSSLDPNGTFDNRLGVWALTGGAAVAAGGTPTLSSIVVASEAYGLPPPSSQKNSSSTIDSGDDRMQQAQFIGGHLWGALTTAVTIPGDSTERAGAAWFSVVPHLAGASIGSATISRQGYEAQAGRDVIYPAIQADPSGRAVMVLTLTGHDMFPSAAFAMLQPTGSQFGAPTIGGAGQGRYDPNATRWGDYSWAVIAPDGKSFWLATEYVPAGPSQTSDGAKNWGTHVMQVCDC